MSTATNKALVRRLVDDVFNQGKLAGLEPLFAPAASSAAGEERTQSLAEIRSAVLVYRTAFPDLHITIEDLVAEDETVVIRWTCHGTHTGTVHGLDTEAVGGRTSVGAEHLHWLVEILPSGRRVRFVGVSFFRLSAGQVTWAWFLFDESAVLRQLGALPMIQPRRGA
jgi:predicted ester cyclase